METVEKRAGAKHPLVARGKRPRTGEHPFFSCIYLTTLMALYSTERITRVRAIVKNGTTGRPAGIFRESDAPSLK